MEAVGKHSFVCTHEDELSFKKGTKLKIINLEDDKNWYTAEIEGKIGLVPVNYIKLKLVPWYIGSISRTEAEELLQRVQSNGVHMQEDGAFLVRASESSPGDFSLSVKIGSTVEHFKVLRDGSNKYFLWVVKFETVNGLIEHHRTSSVCRSRNIFLQDMIKEKVRANYDYTQKGDDEMTLHTGDIISVLNTKDANWWKGEVMRGNILERGFFPSSFTSPYLCD